MADHLCLAICLGALVFAVFAGRAAAAKTKLGRDDGDERPRKKSRDRDDD